MDNKFWALVYALNGFSALCGFCVVFSVLLFAIKEPFVIERVSLRLQTGISLIDLLKHVLFYFVIHGDV
ncbi:hypothetical protein L0F63_005336, partial [Massospora cicadina]